MWSLTKLGFPRSAGISPRPVLLVPAHVYQVLVQCSERARPKAAAGTTKRAQNCWVLPPDMCGEEVGQPSCGKHLLDPAYSFAEQAHCLLCKATFRTVAYGKALKESWYRASEQGFAIMWGLLSSKSRSAVQLPATLRIHMFTLMCKVVMSRWLP